MSTKDVPAQATSSAQVGGASGLDAQAVTSSTMAPETERRTDETAIDRLQQKEPR
jgi:hypothetical protein